MNEEELKDELLKKICDFIIDNAQSPAVRVISKITRATEIERKVFTMLNKHDDEDIICLPVLEEALDNYEKALNEVYETNKERFNYD